MPFPRAIRILFISSAVGVEPFPTYKLQIWQTSAGGCTTLDDVTTYTCNRERFGVVAIFLSASTYTPWVEISLMLAERRSARLDIVERKMSRMTSYHKPSLHSSGRVEVDTAHLEIKRAGYVVSA